MGALTLLHVYMCVCVCVRGRACVRTCICLENGAVVVIPNMPAHVQLCCTDSTCM